MTAQRSTTALRALLLLVATSTLLQVGNAKAQSSPKLGGFRGIGQADGLHAFYNPSGILPIAAPVDLGAPDAYVTIASGGATFARASAADPGDLLANPGALLAQGVPGYQPGTVPAYPYRAVASSGTNPTAESSPGPGLDARASADVAGSSATATMPATNTPAIATFGTMSSTATSSSDGSTVTVHTHSEVTNFNVLGIVTIGSIVTDITATSDGLHTVFNGGTVVSNGAVLGTPVGIDAGGVHEAPGASTTTTNVLSGLLGSVLPGLVGSTDDVLAKAGLHITVAGPVKTGSDNTGALTADGLRIDFELSDQTFPVLKTLLDAVPFIPNPIPGAPSIGDLITVAEARHLVAFEVARGAASLSATTQRSVTAPVVAPSSPALAVAGATGSSGTRAPSRAPAVAPSLGSAAPVLASEAQQAASLTTAQGIGLLAFVVLLAQPFIGSWLAARSRALVAADSFTSCPWEAP